MVWSGLDVKGAGGAVWSNGPARGMVGVRRGPFIMPMHFGPLHVTVYADGFTADGRVPAPQAVVTETTATRGDTQLSAEWRL